MLKCVVKKLSPYCAIMCKHLGYLTTGFGHDNKKNLIAVLEGWISAGEKEGRPKTWSMFVRILSNISELSVVTGEICSELKKAGVHISEFCHYYSSNKFVLYMCKCSICTMCVCILCICCIKCNSAGYKLCKIKYTLIMYFVKCCILNCPCT